MFDKEQRQQVGDGSFAIQAAGGVTINVNGYTVQDHERLLKEREAQLRADLTALHVSQLQTVKQEKRFLEEELENVQKQLADLIQSYQDKILFLQDTIDQLRSVAGGVDAQKLANAIAALKQGQTELADALFAEVEALAQASIERAAKAAFERGKIKYEKRAFKEAFEHYKRAINLVSDNIDYLRYGASHAINVCEYEQALVWLKQSIPLTDELSLYRAGIYNYMGVALLSMGDFDQALQYCNKAIWVCDNALEKFHPEITRAYIGKGRCWMEKGDLRKAEAAFFRALSNEGAARRKKPYELPAIYNNLAGVLIQAKSKPNILKGIRYLNLSKELAIRLYGEQSTLVASSNRNLGGAYLSLKRFGKGLELLEQAKKTYLSYLGPVHPTTKATIELIEFAEKHKNG